ncbi:MAG: 30S ribosomal protein S7 [Leptospirales bacterium]
MARRRTKSLQRKMVPDYVYNSELVTKFINSMMYDGKKSVAEQSFYKALEIVAEKTGENGYEQFKKVIQNVEPTIEVKSRRVGGVTYQVPVEVYSVRKRSLAVRWLIHAARTRSGRTMAQKLANELLDALNNTGGAMKKKDDVRKMADANRAFSHYAW